MKVWEWPRWLNRDLLADYLSIKVPDIRKLMAAGKLPQPSYLLGPKTPRWDRLAVDDVFGVSERAKRRQELEAAVARAIADIQRGGRRGGQHPPRSIYDEQGRRRAGLAELEGKLPKPK